MNAAQVLDHFDRISDAPDAVPRLRPFILDLAVWGKLVEQDPKTEQVANIYLNERRSNALPGNWRLFNFGKFCDIQGGNQPPKSQFVDEPRPGYVRLFQIRDLGENPVPIYISREATNRFCKEGEILIGRYGASVGKIFWAQDGAYNVALAKFIYPANAFVPQFAFLALKSNFFQAKLTGATRSAQAGFNKGDLAEIDFPLPPIAEQHRIVAKVDELMTLCDRLEGAQAERETRRDKLAAASLHRLNNGADADEVREHARFHLRHLPRLTTRPEHIQQLRQTILNLAVRGKLVPQDPSDEPASELLKRIERTRAHLYAEKKIPKPKNLPPLESVEIPFKLGSGWEWTMLGRLCYQVSDGPHHSPKYVSSDTGVPFLSTRNVRADRFDLSDLKYVSREDHEQFCKRIRPERDDILYTKGGTTGIARVNDLDFEFSVWVHVAVLRIAKKFLVPRYVAMALNSPRCYQQSQAYTQGISNYDLGLTRMIKILMPLPPLAEQDRIVAKVDELMTLCDRLEAQLTSNQTESRGLLEAVLHEALNAAH